MNKRYLVVDSADRVMVWASCRGWEGQLVYCDSSRFDEPETHARIYTRKQALRHIRASIAKRTQWGMKVHPYFLVEVTEIKKRNTRSTPKK